MSLLISSSISQKPYLTEVHRNPLLSQWVCESPDNRGSTTCKWTTPFTWCIALEVVSVHHTVNSTQGTDQGRTAVDMWPYWCVLPYCSGDFKRRLPRTPSTGTMSSADDLDEREPPSPSDNGDSDLTLTTVDHCYQCFNCSLVPTLSLYVRHIYIISFSNITVVTLLPCIISYIFCMRIALFSSAFLHYISEWKMMVLKAVSPLTP